MEKVRPWCGQPSDRGRLRNRTEQPVYSVTVDVNLAEIIGDAEAYPEGLVGGVEWGPLGQESPQKNI